MFTLSPSWEAFEIHELHRQVAELQREIAERTMRSMALDPMQELPVAEAPLDEITVKGKQAQAVSGAKRETGPKLTFTPV